MTNKEVEIIVDRIEKQVIDKGRLLYGYEIKEILKAFIDNNRSEEEWIDNLVNRYNESRDFQITDIRDREKLLDDLRPRGKWIGNVFNEHYCNKCGRYALYEEEPDGYYEVQSRFCPNCGAKMKGEENDNKV